MLPPGAGVYSAVSPKSANTCENMPPGVQASGLLAVAAEAVLGAATASESPQAMAARRPRRREPMTNGICTADLRVWTDRALCADTGVPATGLSRDETPGFASPPRDGFALD